MVCKEIEIEIEKRKEEKKESWTKVGFKSDASD